MKRIAPFLLLLLSLSLNGWADNLAQEPVGKPNFVILPTFVLPQAPVASPAVVVTQAPVAVTNVAPKKTYILPSLQEFHYPLQPVYTPAGALFGTKKREEQEIEAYWKTRQVQLDSENKACTELSDDASIKECLQNVRQVERDKTAAIRSINEQRVMQAHERYLNYIQASRSAPTVNVKCRTYGYSTNCNSY